MAKAPFYKGRPVKRMRRVEANTTDGYEIVLTFYGRTRGATGKRITITQADWDKHGEKREVQDRHAESMRKLSIRWIGKT